MRKSVAYRRASEWLRQYANDPNDLRRKLAKNGAFHVARIAAQAWLGVDYDRANQIALQARIADIASGVGPLETHLGAALDLVEEIMRSNPQYMSDPDVALKSSQLDDDIDRRAYQRATSNAGLIGSSSGAA